MKKMVQFRVEPLEYDAWKFAARQAGMTISEWMRQQCNARMIPAAVRPPIDSPVQGSPDSAKTALDEVQRRKARMIEQPSVARRGECHHGVKRGAHCWQCGGKAIITGETVQPE